MEHWIDYIKKPNVAVESWAGAATKLAGYVGMIESINAKWKRYRPDIINGVSAGSIAALIRVKLMMDPSAMNTVIELGTSFNLDDIFNKSPFKNKRSMFKAIWGLITGKPSLGDHSKLLEILEKVFTREDFNEYKQGNFPMILICSVNMENGSMRIANVKEANYTYEMLQKDILASCAIPTVMAPVKINGAYHHDGGVRYSSAGWHIIKTLLNKGIRINKHVSLYSRPKDLTGILDEPIDESKRKFFKFALQFASRTFSIRMYQNSKFCEVIEHKQAQENRFLIKQHFLPNVLESMFDTDPKNLKALYYAGKSAI